MLLVLVAFIFGVLSPNLVTYVLAHGGNLNLIHACVKNSNGNIRIIGPNDTCSSNESSLDWSKTPWNSDFPPMCQNCDLSHDTIGDLFVGKDLSGALFQGSDLRGNDFTTSNLTGTHFYATNLGTTNLQGLNLSGVNWANTHFEWANATNTNFTGADLSQATFNNADFSGSNFTSTNLTQASGMGGAIVTGIIWSNTICPDGTNSNNNGNTCEGHLTP